MGVNTINISINQLSAAFDNVNKDPAAYTLARDIERLADLVDPFEYRDYINEYFNGDIAASVNKLYNDIVNHDADYIAAWLHFIITDPATDPRDKERAENRLNRYNAYMGVTK